MVSVYIHSQFCNHCQLLFTLKNVGGCPSSTWSYQLLFLLLGPLPQQCPLQEIQDPLEALGGRLDLLSLLLNRNISIIQQSLAKLIIGSSKVPTCVISFSVVLLPYFSNRSQTACWSLALATSNAVRPF